MHSSKALSIRWQLRLLLLALAVPFAGFLAISSSRQAFQDREQAGQEMLSVARLTAARLDDHIGDIAQVLAVLATVVDPTMEAVDKNDALLNSLSSRLPPQINNLSVWTASGQNAGTLDRRLRLAGINVADRKFFRDALEAPGLAIEAPIASFSNGRIVGIFAIRIERKGHVVGVVAVSAQLQDLQSLLAPTGAIPSGGVVTVTDARGVVLARSIDPDQWIGKSLLQSGGGVAQSRQLHDGVRDGPSADGVERIAGFTVASRVPWLVYVGLPTKVALAPVHTRLFENIAAGAVMMAVAMWLAASVARRIAHPLQQLEVDARELEQGQLSHRSVVHGAQEITSLANTLNRMAESLQQRTQMLESSKESLRRLAQHDALTGLPNRALFIERLERSLRRAVKQRMPFALLFLDLDHFKEVNDGFGHERGDELLKDIARCLETTVRSTDTVARLAGDEFTVILDSVAGVDEVSCLAAALVECARSSIDQHGHKVCVTTSIGVALSETEDTVATILARADAALYEAKRLGRDRYRIAAGVAGQAGAAMQRLGN
jgi:diguanylate cyclase (GGDEF)-like protein